MSGRIDWKNYDYSEGPPPRGSYLLKKASVPPREPQDPYLFPAVSLSPPSIYKAPKTRIVSQEAIPKSTNDLTNYEEELLAKITSKQDRDRTLTYRPSHSKPHRGIQPTPLTQTNTLTNLTESEINQSPSTIYNDHRQHHHTDPLQKKPPSGLLRPANNGNEQTSITRHKVPPSPIIQKSSGEIPYDSVSFPLDEDPMQHSSSSTSTNLNYILEDPPSLNRQATVLEFDQDKYAYTSLGIMESNPHKDEWESQSEDENNKYSDNIEYDSSAHVDETKPMETEHEGCVEDEIMMWNQARDEWNEMFQAIQETYQCASNTNNSSTNSISPVPSQEEHLPITDNPTKPDNSTPVIKTVAPFTDTKTSSTLINPSSQQVSKQVPTKSSTMKTTAHEKSYPDIDSEIDDDEEEERENIETVNNKRLSKLEFYNDTVEKQRYEKMHPSHHPEKTFVLNTSNGTRAAVDNSPRVHRGPRYEPKSLMLDDEYDSMESDYESLETHNRYNSEQDKTTMAPGTSSHIVNKPPTMNRVGFHSDDMNQVHEYTPEEEPSIITDEYDDDGTYQSEATRSLTLDSLAGRSLNSLYSKSNLSEVEDFFSDILFLGSSDYRNPGKRPLKYKSNRRRQADQLEELRYKKERDCIVRDQMRTGSIIDADDGDISTDADESMTLTTVDDERTKETSTLDKTEDESYYYDDKTFDDTKDEDGTFLDTVDEEDTSYQGTYLDESTTHLERYRKRHEGRRSRDEEDDDEPSSLSVLWGFFENSISAIHQAIEVAISNSSETESRQTESSITMKTSRRVMNQDTEALRREDFMRIAMDSVFRGKMLMAHSSQSSERDDIDMEEALTQISLSAARARHAAKNLMYDETATIDVAKHIKIFSVILSLPLGLLFEESPHCCWVSRIFENGNASLMTEEKVLLGDHIVAVDEISVVSYKVAKVCKVLSFVQDPSCVELTFLRYIGPIRHSSANMEHEGYEVVDPILSRSQQVRLEKPMKQEPSLTSYHNANIQRAPPQEEKKKATSQEEKMKSTSQKEKEKPTLQEEKRKPTPQEEKKKKSTPQDEKKNTTIANNNSNQNDVEINPDNGNNKSSKFKLFKIFRRR